MCPVGNNAIWQLKSPNCHYLYLCQLSLFQTFGTIINRTFLFHPALLQLPVKNPAYRQAGGRTYPLTRFNPLTHYALSCLRFFSIMDVRTLIATWLFPPCGITATCPLGNLLIIFLTTVVFPEPVPPAIPTVSIFRIK